jgi:alanyl-tRNA synthetase
MILNAFKLHDTHGMPLSSTLDCAEEKNMNVSIPHFYRDAVKAGWKPERALAVIDEALTDDGCDRKYIEAAKAFLTDPEKLQRQVTVIEAE